MSETAVDPDTIDEENDESAWACSKCGNDVWFKEVGWGIYEQTFVMDKRGDQDWLPEQRRYPYEGDVVDHIECDECGHTMESFPGYDMDTLRNKIG